MKVLHYTLGFPPSRTGGLVAYAIDLMEAQRDLGHQVVALFPDNQLIFSNDNRVHISRKKGLLKEITTYGLKNSLPLPLFGGISRPSDFMKEIEGDSYRAFLMQVKPDVIHIHSLMGLHKEFFEVARGLHIKLVFTTHDYFGLAPLPSFYYDGCSYDHCLEMRSWNIMSGNALSVPKLRLFQNPLYSCVRQLLKALNRNPKHQPDRPANAINYSIDYTPLKDYYRGFFELIDYFHFNSSLTRGIYQFHLGDKIAGEVLAISNKKIAQTPLQKKSSDKTRIAYIGPDEAYKGYFDFLQLTEFIQSPDVEWHTYGHVKNSFTPDKIVQHGKFNSHEIDTIFAAIDLLILPSKWKETFGLIGLEALSRGVPVFVSENVGVKDFIDRKYHFDDIKQVKELLEKDLSGYTFPIIPTMLVHAEEVVKMYQALTC